MFDRYICTFFDINIIKYIYIYARQTVDHTKQEFFQEKSWWFSDQTWNLCVRKVVLRQNNKDKIKKKYKNIKLALRRSIKADRIRRIEEVRRKFQEGIEIGQHQGWQNIRGWYKYAPKDGNRPSYEKMETLVLEKVEKYRESESQETLRIPRNLINSKKLDNKVLSIIEIEAAVCQLKMG